MDSFSAFARGMAARAQGKPQMVFDWDKAARLIKERKPREASAGLSQDWEYTGGVIYKNGQIVTDSYTYLSSNWATPELSLDGEITDCYVMEEDTEWGADTKWPESAINILQEE